MTDPEEASIEALQTATAERIASHEQLQASNDYTGELKFARRETGHCAGLGPRLPGPISAAITMAHL